MSTRPRLSPSLLGPLVAALALAAMAACSSDPATAPECVSDDDCDGICVDGSCVAAVDAGVDVADTDTEPDVEDDADVDDVDDGGEDDTDAAPDVAPDVACEGGFQCPCEENSDCDSNLCIASADGDVCTVPCTETCPDPAWDCRLIQGSTGDVVQICVPPTEILCEECDTDFDCGGLDDLCLPQSDGTFCGRDCSLDGLCPEGYLCDTVTRTEAGEPVQYEQCVPELGVCGDCLDNDDDGYGIGPSCLGSDCDDLRPNVYEGAPEICDGIDNNCANGPDETFNFNTDLAHCGGCGIVCAPDNASEFSCDEGDCTVGVCETGFGNCNDTDVDGCEVDTTTSLDHCGGCDLACAFDNGRAECADSTCSLVTCLESFRDCNDELSDGCETDILTDEDHCGTCGAPCEIRNAVTECADGTCTFVECLPNFADCNARLDDGCEVDLRDSAAHCGACNAACDLPGTDVNACVDSMCVPVTCDETRRDCNEDPADGCEINVLIDPLNCGECENECTVAGGSAICAAGTCAVSECTPPTFDCNEDASDGCEVNLTNDPLNCGFCGFECATTNVAVGGCLASSCIIADCSDNFGDCNDNPADGCERDLRNSTAHCGACDNPCNQPNAINVCADGSCDVVDCAPGYVDLDGDLSNGCDYLCTPIGSDQPDSAGLDADCDGIDGDIDASIFVSTAGVAGNDGLTPDTPVPSLQQGLNLANVSFNRKTVLVAAGTYSGGTLDVPEGVSVIGGYTTNFTGRVSTWAQYDSEDNVGMTIGNARAPVTIEWLTITTPNQSSGGWTVGATVDDCDDYVTILNSRILPGRGGDGGPGAAGTGSLTSGGDGSNGDGSTGGNGGATPGGTKGGDGGDGVRRERGGPGDNGNANGSSLAGIGGAGGSSGRGCGDGDAGPGGNGTDGGDGGRGTHGGGAGGLGSLSGLSWVADSGSAGGRGGTGGSGGGGGAGAGEDCSPVGCDLGFCGTGRGGGGGGGGGQGGAGGQPGQSGGASIGMIIRNSEVSMARSSINAARGGSGGRGGDGQSGAGGGDGGSGRTGGDGGAGGCGGGGGGGPSIGVWGASGASIVMGTDANIGNSSGGSAGTSCGDGGSVGSAANTRNVTLR